MTHPRGRCRRRPRRPVARVADDHTRATGTCLSRPGRLPVPALTESHDGMDGRRRTPDDGAQRDRLSSVVLDGVRAIR